MINRETEYKIMDEIKKRWSPRAFAKDKDVSDESIMALLEAARYAPSCYNEQPWEYIIGRKNETDYDKIIDSLIEYNKGWALSAPILVVVLSKKNFRYNKKPNRWNMFDAGTSFGYLSLEAQRRGMITHAMGGFKSLTVKEEFDALAPAHS